MSYYLGCKLEGKKQIFKKLYVRVSWLCVPRQRWGLQGWLSLRSCEKLTPCLIKPVSAGSKTDLPLAKAKPISDGGNTSGIAYLRKERKNCGETAVKREEWDEVRETSLQTPRSVGRRGEEVLKMLEQRVFPWSSWWRPWWGRLSPCSPWRSRWWSHPCKSMMEQISTCSPWKGPQPRAGGYLKEAVTTWGAPCWSRLLPGPADPWREEPMPKQVCWQGLWPHGGPTLEQPVPEGLHPMEGTYIGAVREELQPLGRTHIGEVCGELSPMRGTFTLEQGKSVRSLPPEG